ncbi:Hsp20/alpha crystallin family protein [candidate division WOR-3 bacterium]|nr:Hsp20/alpha crystallin family protein [candidate division WOR-3 bacterium]
MSRHRQLRVVSAFGREMDELFEQFFGPDTSEAVWQPLVDLYVTEDKVCLLAEVPGVNQDDIHIAVGAESVLITGVKRVPAGARHGASFYESEIPYGSFDKRVALPVPVRPDSLQAELVNGIIRLEIARRRPPAKVVRVD